MGPFFVVFMRSVLTMVAGKVGNFRRTKFSSIGIHWR